MIGAFGQLEEWGLGGSWCTTTEIEKVKIMDELRIDLQPNSKIKKIPLFQKGSFEFTEHGIFNPSVIAEGQKLTMIFRTEPSQATWSGYFLTDKGVPQIAEGRITRKGLELENPKPIESGMPLACRPEDWRIFRHKSRNYTNFTNYFYLNKGFPQKTTQSRTALGILHPRSIRFIREMSASKLGYKSRREEKNWVFFSNKSKLWCIYSMEPFTIFECDDLGHVIKASKSLKRFPRLGWRFLANSTNPIKCVLPKFGEVFLMFCHQYLTPNGKGSRNRTYYQHAVIFSVDDHTPLAWTPAPVTGGGVSTTGRHDGVVYFSGAFSWDHHIYATSGEGDSHSAIYQIPHKELVANLRKV